MRRQSSGAAGGRWIVPGLALGLAAAAMLLYLPTRRHGFVVVDDGTYLYANPHVSQGLTWDGVAWAFTTFRAGNWHPFTWLSHMLDVSLFGMNPGGHHLVGAAIHAAATALLFVFLARATGAWGRSAFVAAAFSLHPLRVESVAWAAERKDQLAALFWMLALLAYLHYTRRPTTGRYVVVAATLAAGLLCKPMLVTLPIVFLLLDVWPLGRTGWRRLLLEKVPLALLAAASAAVTFLAQRAGEAVVSLERVPLATRCANAAWSYAAYIGQTLWPADLAVHYPFPSAGARAVDAAAFVGLAAVSVAALRFGRRCPAAAVGWLWYMVTLVPVIGLVQVGTQARADRYTYLPSIGLAIAAAWGAAALVERRPGARRAVAVVAALAIAACVPATRRQIDVWRDSVALFENAASVAPESAFSRLNLGVAYLDAQRPDDAERELHAAARLSPREPRARFNLGNLLRARGDLAAAEGSYRAALLLDPDYPDAHLNLGVVLMDRGRAGEARTHFCLAARLAPASLAAAVNCANATALEGDNASAIALYRRALGLEPGYLPARVGLAGRLLATGRHDEGFALLERVVAERPASAAAYLLYATELDRRGRAAEALAAWREVLRLDPENAAARRRLGGEP